MLATVPRKFGPVFWNAIAVSVVLAFLGAGTTLVPIDSALPKVVGAFALGIALVIAVRIVRWGVHSDSTTSRLFYTKLSGRREFLAQSELSMVDISGFRVPQARSEGGVDVPIFCYSWYRSRSLFSYGIVASDHTALNLSKAQQDLLEQLALTVRRPPIAQP